MVIRPANQKDMPFIEEKIKEFHLDDENLQIELGTRNLLKSSNESVYQNAERVQW